MVGDRRVIMTETERQIYRQTNKDRERECERLLGHVPYGLFIQRGMFSHMLSTGPYNKPG